MLPMKPTLDPESSSPDFLAPIADVRAPDPLQFPEFPTLASLLSHAAGGAPPPLLRLSETKPPSEPTSLFQGLLGGNLSTLVADSTDHPERYTEETQLFLSELGTGTRTLANLTPADKVRLDSAVVDFASYRPPQLPPRPLPPALERAHSRAPNNPYTPGLADGRAPQVEIAGAPMDSYWWVTGDRA